MKVLYLIEELGGGGKERRLVELLKGLSSDRSFNLHLVLTKENDNYPEVKQLPIEIRYLKGLSDFELILRYSSIFKEIQPDIVHTWTYKTTFYTAFLKPFFRFKVIAGFIGDTKGQSKKLQIVSNYLIYKRSNLVISNTKTGLDAHKVTFNKGCVVVNGFDPNRLNKIDKTNTILKSMGVNTSFTVVMVANVRKSKDYKTFIEVAERMVAKRDDVTFISIGGIHPEFENMVSPYINNKHKRIKFLGHQPNPELIIQESDIGVLCSNREGMSNSILEYMAAGLPVITTDLIGGSKELVVNNETGFLCRPEMVFEKICLLLDNIDLRRRLGANGASLIKNEFSLTKMVEEYIKIYNTL